MRSPADIFSEHCAREELAYQVDREGRPVFYPRLGELEWRVSAGAGTVYATTTIRPRGGEPYDVSLVDLDERYRVMSTVDGGGVIGARVQGRVEDDRLVFGA